MVEYTDKYNDKLTSLNQSISDFKAAAEKELRDATFSIEIREQEKIRAGNDAALIEILDTDIMNIKKACVMKLNSYNADGHRNMNEAIKLLEDYNSYFNTELKFCLEKISFYWTSFYTIYNKKYGHNNDLKWNKDILTAICKDNNPVKNFKVTQYTDVISPYRNQTT
jgi:hypothetical protein